jgi:threonine/homoserine/homoserine lactone efflux protein
MQCNIDKRGQALRTSLGVVTALVGVGLLAARFAFQVATVPTWAGIAAIAGGAFMIFEGVNGWCVVRAMGFKTPI